MLSAVVAFVDGDTFGDFVGIAMVTFSGGRCKNAATAVTAEYVAG